MVHLGFKALGGLGDLDEG
jgi:hypothetical protein